MALPSNRSAIEISGLFLDFKNKSLFRNFSLSVQKGEMAAVQGRSGSGKTTLLKCLLGFISPDRGRIRILDQELDAKTIWDLRRHMAYVPQEPDLGRGKVIDLLRKSLAFKVNRHLEKNFDRIEDMMSAFLLDPCLLQENTRKLSGGEKQRFALISALLLNRNILLLDEHTSALDEKAADAVLQYLRRLEKTSILLVTHSKKIADFCDRVVFLKTGKGTETE